MDLREIVDIHARRHPWETARLKAIRNILRPHFFEGMRVIDVGCGDGFVCGNLFASLRSKEITAVDIHLSDALLCELANGANGITYQREMPDKGAFDLMLLLDVIEHVERDREFVRGLVERYVAGNGKVLITVPAFQALLGRHDLFLGHYRRYNLAELVALATASGLAVISSGYLFFSLLLPKLLLFKLLAIGNAADGVGNWRGGKLATFLVEALLKIDNAILLAAGRMGVKIPGLTGWILCKKQG